MNLSHLMAGIVAIALVFFCLHNLRDVVERALCSGDGTIYGTCIASSNPTMTNATFQSDRTILVTSALPYAKRLIHLGYLVEYIQTDI